MADDINNGEERFLEIFFADCRDEKTFYKEADEYIKTHVDNSPCVLVVEINNYRFLYLWYGRTVSKRYFTDVMRCLADCKKEFDGVLGFFGGARFALCIPCDADQIETVRRRLRECRAFQNNVAAFFPITGVCRARDGGFSASVMYDKALSVLRGLRKNYTEHLAEYKHEADDDGMEERRSTYNAYTDIRRGLNEGEFVFFLQPKCDMRTGKILGAEALVRWNHKERGLVPPDEFIPLLERGGLVSMVDRFVWEEVFAWQRKWIDAGRKPLPISINVSRIDMLSFDVAAYMKSLSEQYKIEPRLVEIEITESLYVKSGKVILKTVDALKAAGFPLLMDDFGSGYSSLNVLRNIDFDILKIDMKFLFKPDEHEQKGINILESVINMARLLNLPVIIEGVETAEQVKLLIEMGCRYAQGYYYYKPMPVEDYEKLVNGKKNVDYSGFKVKHVDQIHLRELTEHTDISDTVLNDLLGAVVFYDVHDGVITTERANEPFFRIFHFGAGRATADIKRHALHIQKGEYDNYLALFDKAYDNRPRYAFGSFHFRLRDGKTHWVCLRVFFLHERDGHRRYVGSFVDISPLMNDEQNGQKQNAQNAENKARLAQDEKSAETEA